MQGQRRSKSQTRLERGRKDAVGDARKFRSASESVELIRTDNVQVDHDTKFVHGCIFNISGMWRDMTRELKSREPVRLRTEVVVRGRCVGTARRLARVGRQVVVPCLPVSAERKWQLRKLMRAVMLLA